MSQYFAHPPFALDLVGNVLHAYARGYSNYTGMVSLAVNSVNFQQFCVCSLATLFMKHHL